MNDPLIHAEKDGSSEGWITTTKGIVKISATDFVPGHGMVQSKKDIEERLTRTEKKREQIKMLVAQGNRSMKFAWLSAILLRRLPAVAVRTSDFYHCSLQRTDEEVDRVFATKKDAGFKRPTSFCFYYSVVALFLARVHHAPDLALLAVADIQRSIGALRHAIRRYTASPEFFTGAEPLNPSANTSKAPEGFPPANGWNVML